MNRYQTNDLNDLIVACAQLACIRNVHCISQGNESDYNLFKILFINDCVNNYEINIDNDNYIGSKILATEILEKLNDLTVTKYDNKWKIQFLESSKVINSLTHETEYYDTLIKACIFAMLIDFPPLDFQDNYDKNIGVYNGLF